MKKHCSTTSDPISILECICEAPRSRQHFRGRLEFDRESFQAKTKCLEFVELFHNDKKGYMKI